MANISIPQVGSRGFYTAVEPFSNVVLEDILYTIVSVRSLREIVSNGEDILTTLYINNGLTEDDYYSDLAGNVFIIGMESEGGIIYVPSNRLTPIAGNDTVSYQSLVISVPLGPLPTDTNVNFLLEEIKDLVTGFLGVIPNPEVLKTSAVTEVDKSTHLSYIQTLEGNRTNRKTTQQKYKETLTALNDANSIIQKLECYIKNYRCKNGEDINYYTCDLYQTTGLINEYLNRGVFVTNTNVRYIGPNTSPDGNTYTNGGINDPSDIPQDVLQQAINDILSSTGITIPDGSNISFTESGLLIETSDGKTLAIQGSSVIINNPDGSSYSVDLTTGNTTIITTGSTTTQNTEYSLLDTLLTTGCINTLMGYGGSYKCNYSMLASDLSKTKNNNDNTSIYNFSILDYNTLPCSTMVVGYGVLRSPLPIDELTQ